MWGGLELGIWCRYLTCTFLIVGLRAFWNTGLMLNGVFLLPEHPPPCPGLEQRTVLPQGHALGKAT